MQSWISLLAAILFEVAGTTSMKLSQGFSKALPSVFIFLFYGCAVAALTVALKRVDISVAYAIWSGLGTALIAAIGMIWFREPVTYTRLASILLIIIGIIGLNLGSARP
jgi:small multidrug resistance pump